MTGNPYFEPERSADFPRAEGAACSGCGRWHHRYGDAGEGAFCGACRDATRQGPEATS